MGKIGNGPDPPLKRINGRLEAVQNGSALLLAHAEGRFSLSQVWNEDARPIAARHCRMWPMPPGVFEIKVPLFCDEIELRR